jgi:hypothetical protein
MILIGVKDDLKKMKTWLNCLFLLLSASTSELLFRLTRISQTYFVE